jgi:lipopolysaccharide assembly outer membrane protein LptD (OstA)
MADNTMNLLNGQYTTCDEYDHPHFYIQLTKAKTHPGRNIVAGPAYLVIEDVPLPLGLPFGFFPFTQSYSSGIIMPTYGEETTQYKRILTPFRPSRGFWKRLWSIRRLTPLFLRPKT